MKFLGCLLLFLFAGFSFAMEEADRKEYVREQMKNAFGRAAGEYIDPTNTLGRVLRRQLKLKISDEEVTQALLSFIDLAFIKSDDKEEPNPWDMTYGHSAIYCLVKYNPGKEETRQLLLSLIGQDSDKPSVSAAWSTYLDFIADSLTDDPFIEEIMTGERKMILFYRQQIYLEIIAYFNMAPSKKNKTHIMKKILYWSGLKCNWDLFKIFDQFLVKNMPGYEESEKRRENMFQAAEFIMNDPDRSDRYGRDYIMKILKIWPQ